MEPFIGQIMAVGFNFAPRGWAFCNGQLLSINSYPSLYSLLGTAYGGDGVTSFGLPDLRGRTLLHTGQGPGLDMITRGERGGYTEVTLTNANLPAHNHLLMQRNGGVQLNVETTIYTTDNGYDTAESDNGNNGLGTSGNMPEIYREAPTQSDHLAGVATTATISGTTELTGSQHGFNIRNPFLGVNMIIALEGIFPSRS